MTNGSNPQSRVQIGTAGWTVPKAYASNVEATGSHLERYASVLGCVEINATFYRLPRQTTLARWAAGTPDTFRFALKAPKAITHTRKLISCGAELVQFVQVIAPLGDKLGPILLQLPPSLAYDEGVAHEFFTTLREIYTGAAVLEPRHASWFAPGVDQLLRSFEVARAVADPPKGAPRAGSPGGWPALRYFRLHGSPRTYWSDYPETYLEQLATTLCTGRTATTETWVIFDNTAQGYAFGNALALRRLLDAR